MSKRNNKKKNLKIALILCCVFDGINGNALALK